MNLSEAKTVIRNDAASFTEWVKAAGILTSSTESSFEDLIACLKRCGLPAEMAATALYVRTKRPRADDSIESIILDPNDWISYLSNKSAR